MSILSASRVSLGLPASPLGGEGGFGPSLNFVVQHQAQSEWCWAAVSSSIANFFGSSNWTQCSLVNRQLNQIMCCSYGSSGGCNQPWYLDQALTTVGHFRLFTVGSAALSQVQAEISAGRPLPVRIQWSNGGGHFIAIAGCANNTLDIQDPWSGQSTVDYETFIFSYRGSGSWTHCYWVM